MKRLQDLRSYSGTLPYDSELFGIYQPLLGWQSQRILKRVQATASPRIRDLLQDVSAQLEGKYSVQFLQETAQLQVEELAVATPPPDALAYGIAGSEIARALPPSDQYSDSVWADVLSPEALQRMLVEKVVPRAAETYARLTGRATSARDRVAAEANAEQVTRSILDGESRMAGAFQLLFERAAFPSLYQIFYAPSPPSRSALDSLSDDYDPFVHLDPKSQLGHVRLSRSDSRAYTESIPSSWTLSSVHRWGTSGYRQGQLLSWLRLTLGVRSKSGFENKH